MNTKVVNATRQVTRFLNTNSPAIFTGFAVAGVISTTIFTAQAVPKAMELLEEERLIRANETLTLPVEPLTWVEMVKVAWKPFIPVVISGGLTIAFIVSSHTVNTRRNAALAGLYSLSESTLKDYKDKVFEKFGEKRAEEVRDEVAQSRVNRKAVDDKFVENTGNGQTLCYDALSGRYFRSDMECIKQALNGVSRKLMSEMFISLNEVYYALDLSSIGMGDLLGWNIDETGPDLIKGDFSSVLTADGTPCLVLDFTKAPKVERPF